MTNIPAADDPTALVRRLRVAITTKRLPDDIAAWLEDGLNAFCQGTAPTLCRALGLRGPGRNGRIATVLKVRCRNEALRAAADSLQGETDRARAEALAPLVRRFESDTWPRVRSLDEPPERFNATQRALWKAFHAGQPPRSPGGILAAIRQQTT